ncbi:hypothetical protein BJR05_23540 [Bacillus cereus]|nr:hypothetical protein BJR05_23540 [Bacillus cereus]
MNKDKKQSLYLLLGGLTLMMGAKATGNIYIAGAGLIIGMAITAAEVTEIFLNWKNRKKDDK